MEKRSEINEALKTAMKNGEKLVVSTIRLILAAMKDRDISAREKGNSQGITNDEILLMLQSMIKQRQESAKTYSEAGRDDLAEREEAEVEIIRSFMPKQLSETEVSDAVKSLIAQVGATGIKDMGKVMNALKEQYAGQIDMGKAGGVVKALLSAA